MNLLDHPLVRKYFPCQWCRLETAGRPIHACDESRATQILQSMQEPLKKGEKYLNWRSMNILEELTTCDVRTDGCITNEINENFRLLRLPDCFQKQPEPHFCDCEFCGHPDTSFGTTKDESPCYGNHSGLLFCERCGLDLKRGTKKDEVEEKIEYLIKYFPEYCKGGKAICEDLLRARIREIVELARKK